MSKRSLPLRNDGRQKRLRLLTILVLLLLIGSGVFLAGTNLWAWYNYNAAKKAIETGDYQRAEKYLDCCLMFWSGNGQVHFWMARTARCLGQYDKAEKQLHKCDELNWPQPGIDLEEKLLRAQRGEFAELEQTLIELAEKDNEDTAAVMEVLAHFYAANSRIESAMYWSDRFLRHSPDNVTALLIMAQSYQMGHDSAHALKYYHMAIAIQPDNDTARQALASALVEFNEPKKALVQYQESQSRGVKSKEVLLGLAHCYRALGQGEEAAEKLDQLLLEYPLSWEVWSEQGNLAMQQRELAKAERSFRKSLTIKPHQHATLYSLYLCLRKQGPARQTEANTYHARYKKVLKDARRLDELITLGIREHPKDPEILCEAGTLFMRLGKEKTGEHWLLRALQFQPRHRGARDALAAYYEKNGRKDLAGQYR